MPIKLIMLLFSACPMLAFSQTYISADSANKIIMDGGNCSDRTYTKSQIPPSLTISKQSFADSLSTYLNSKGKSYEDGTIKMSFVVDCHSKIKNVRKLTCDIEDATIFNSAVLRFSDLWLPARQNNYIVSAYVSLEIQFKNNKLSNIIISQ